jgi:hypothetical protein
MIKIKDVEAFIKGAEEIDKKRKAVARIMGFLEGCIKAGWPIKKIEKDREIKFEGGFLSIYTDRRLALFIFSAGNINWSANGSNIPARSVLLVYEKIPEIIMCLHYAYPDLKIIESFNFFVNIAPVE